jgi:hypothetical protein
MRYASVTGARDSDEVAAYLPGNYEVYGHRFPDGPSGRIVVLIRGVDTAGWTLDDYVIPRLASGSMGCEEAKPQQREYITNAAFKQQKSRLTRAKNSGDPLNVLDAVEKTLGEWEGKVWPDDWNRWRIALEDARWEYERGGDWLPMPETVLRFAKCSERF